MTRTAGKPPEERHEPPPPPENRCCSNRCRGCCCCEPRRARCPYCCSTRHPAAVSGWPCGRAGLNRRRPRTEEMQDACLFKNSRRFAPEGTESRKQETEDNYRETGAAPTTRKPPPPIGAGAAVAASRGARVVHNAVPRATPQRAACATFPIKISLPLPHIPAHVHHTRKTHASRVHTDGGTAVQIGLGGIGAHQNLFPCDLRRSLLPGTAVVFIASGGLHPFPFNRQAEDEAGREGETRGRIAREPGAVCGGLVPRHTHHGEQAVGYTKSAGRPKGAVCALCRRCR